MVGFLDGLQKFPGIYLRVYPMVVFRMAQENQVVYGHHAADICLADAKGQFATQSVIDLYLVPLQVFYQTLGSPPSLIKGQK